MLHSSKRVSLPMKSLKTFNNMKKNLLSLIAICCTLIVLDSCKTSKNTTSSNNTSTSSSKQETTVKTDIGDEKVPMVGNDADEHGCKASTGYTYSTIQDKCIRLFEEGIRLEPKSPELNQTSSAFLVFKTLDENEQAEVFLPNNSKSVVFLKTGGQNEWIGNGMQLIQNNKTFSLYANDGSLKYEGIDQR